MRKEGEKEQGQEGSKRERLFSPFALFFLIRIARPICFFAILPLLLPGDAKSRENKVRQGINRLEREKVSQTVSRIIYFLPGCKARASLSSLSDDKKKG